MRTTICCADANAGLAANTSSLLSIIRIVVVETGSYWYGSRMNGFLPSRGLAARSAAMRNV
jgi:hypothetical protein